MEKEGAEQFGRWFKERRKKAGFKTQAEFIRHHPIVTRTVLSKLEQGKATIRTENALALGRAVGASDMETIVATGMIQGVTPGDVQLVEKFSRMTGDEQFIVEGVIDVLMKRRDRDRDGASE